ncbi:MAG: glycosyltransferase family 39 protein [Pseudomonadota bacterium]
MTLLESLSTGWKAWCLLALITFSAAVPGVAFLPALDRDESRFAQASKQMLETQDFIRIRYQDENRNKKPAGIHWLQAASTAVVSSADARQIWSYRLPSLVGAILATLATFWCGRALIGRRGAFLGAALFGSTLLLTSEAHIAKTDAVLVFLTAVAMGALARIYNGPSGDTAFRWALLFWFAAGLSFLIKGPVTPLVAGLALLVISIARSDLGWARPLHRWQGPLLFVLLVLPWFVWIQIATAGDYLEGAVGKDLRDKLVTASEGHGGLPGYHLSFLVTHFFPATLFLVPALVLFVRTLRGRTLDTLAAERQGLVFLAAWLLPTWIFFELIPTKLSHYSLPAYPALALICGWCIVKLMSGTRLPVSLGASAILFALAIAALSVLVSPLGLSVLQLEAAGDFRNVESSSVLASWVPDADTSLSLLMLAGLAGLATMIALIMREYGASVGFAIVSSLALGWHIRAVAMPHASWVQPTEAARLALAEVCALGSDNLPGCPTAEAHAIRAVGYAEPSFVFTTGTDVTIPPYTVIDLPEDLTAYPVTFLLNLEDAAGVTSRSALVQEAGERRLCTTQSEPVHVLNYSNGDPVTFLALRIDGEPCAAETTLRAGD